MHESYDGRMRPSILVVVVVAAACGNDESSTPSDNGGSSSGTTTSDAAVLADAGSDAPTDASTDANADAGPPDPCATALFCEHFDGYSSVSAITNNQKLGPWHAALQTGATMNLDGAHTTSGAKALHVHIDKSATAGGRLFADGMQPIFAGMPGHVYGRLKMYIDPNGTSIHWTFFGVNGPADPSSPANGRNASYILSSLPKSNANTYSFVYGLSAQGNDGFHDCSSQSKTAMPTASWACIAWDLDSIARKLRMYKDADATAILSVDDHGTGCVAPTSATSPWYGPIVNQLFVGAWSFHAMDDPLDVWIDDLVVDTKPVSCP